MSQNVTPRVTRDHDALQLGLPNPRARACHSGRRTEIRSCGSSFVRISVLARRGTTCPMDSHVLKELAKRTRAGASRLPHNVMAWRSRSVATTHETLARPGNKPNPRNAPMTCFRPRVIDRATLIRQKLHAELVCHGVPACKSFEILAKSSFAESHADTMAMCQASVVLCQE